MLQLSSTLRQRRCESHLHNAEQNPQPAIFRRYADSLCLTQTVNSQRQITAIDLNDNIKEYVIHRTAETPPANNPAAPTTANPPPDQDDDEQPPAGGRRPARRPFRRAQPGGGLLSQARPHRSPGCPHLLDRRCVSLRQRSRSRKPAAGWRNRTSTRSTLRPARNAHLRKQNRHARNDRRRRCRRCDDSLHHTSKERCRSPIRSSPISRAATRRN